MPLIRKRRAVRPTSVELVCNLSKELTTSRTLIHPHQNPPRTSVAVNKQKQTQKPILRPQTMTQAPTPTMMKRTTGST